MVQQIELERQFKPQIEEDSAKRQQIIQGAHAVFLAQGFDAASMNISPVRRASRRGRFMSTSRIRSSFSKPFAVRNAPSMLRGRSSFTLRIGTSRLPSHASASTSSDFSAAQKRPRRQGR